MERIIVRVDAEPASSLAIDRVIRRAGHAGVERDGAEGIDDVNPRGPHPLGRGSA